jgi:hypothetical protein
MVSRMQQWPEGYKNSCWVVTVRGALIDMGRLFARQSPDNAKYIPNMVRINETQPTTSR